MKKQLRLTLALLMCIYIVFALASCKYINFGKNDVDASSCEHLDEDGDNICDRCSVSVSGGKASCVHIAAEPVRENVLDADCTLDGGYDEVVYCSVPECGAVISRSRRVIPSGHSYSGYTCTACGEDRPASVGLKFDENGDGTCSVSGIGDCTDATVVVPRRSPLGDEVTGIGSHAFAGCTDLVSVYMPSGVTTIGAYAFTECISLTEVYIPDGVVAIGDSAFEYCTDLGGIDIPDSVVSIGKSSFRFCADLLSISIPAGVLSIGYRAFFGCSTLTSVVFAATDDWYISEANDERGIALRAALIDDPSSAAECLVSTHGDYHWYKLKSQEEWGKQPGEVVFPYL